MAFRLSGINCCHLPSSIFNFILEMNRTRPFLNKLTMQKQLQIVDVCHSLNMKLIKPITSKHMEHSEHITINNTKREKLKETRQLQIWRENKILLNKITAVMNKQGSYSMSKTMNFRTKVNKSLNLTERKKQDKHILEENKRFLSRLQHKKATMNLQKLHKDWCDNKQVIKRMSNRDFYLAALRSQDNYRQASANNKIGRAKIETGKINRLCVIDGYKMRIRVKFVGELLNITADCLDNTHLKQISIAKDEAIYFIESECNGKMEQLIEKLKYDHENDALLLISDSLAEVSDQDLHIYNPQVETTAKQKHFLEVPVYQKQKDKIDKRINKNSINLSRISEEKVSILHNNAHQTLNVPLQAMEGKIQFSDLMQNEEYNELFGLSKHDTTFNQTLIFNNNATNQLQKEEAINYAKKIEQRREDIVVQPEQMEDYNQIIVISDDNILPVKGKAQSLINDQSTY